MSKIYVDEIAGIASADTVAIPGHVIQVVQGTYASEIDITSGSYVDTGISASITPSSSTNKILILATLASTGAYETAGAQAQGAVRIYRNPTTVYESYLRRYNYANNGGFVFSNNVISYLDSPNTTTSITYAIQGLLINGDAFRFQNNNATSTIQLMEIAG